MLKLLTLIFLTLSTTLAYEISIEGESGLINCSANALEDLFHCKNRQGDDFLIKSKDWDFVALKRNSKGVYQSLEVYSISGKNDSYIYAASFDRNSFLEQSKPPTYRGPIHDYINKERYLYSDFFKDTDGTELDNEHENLKKFFQLAKSEIESKKEKVEKAQEATVFKVKLKDGQEINCSREAESSCSILDCEKDKQGIERKILNPKSAFSIYLEEFSFKNNKFIVPENSILGLYDSDGNGLITYEREKEKSFKDSMLVPSSFKNNPRLFNDLKEPSFKSLLANRLKGCEDKVIKSILDTHSKAQEDLQSATMVQYIELANGILESNYINTESIPGNTCFHRGAYFGLSAYEKSLANKSMSKKTISLEQAQDLLDQVAFRKDIAWNYTLDGCYARAHIMARIFEDQGVHVDKAWLRGSLRIPGQPDGMNWGYHVAPLVYVEDDSGNIQEMIIDPSISQAPMTPKAWAETMKVDFDQTEQVVYPTPTNTAFYNKTSYSVTNSNPYWPDYNDRLTEYDKENMAAQTMLNFGAAPQSDNEWEQWEY